MCLGLEKGLSQEIIRESPGMLAHVANILVLVLIPMVIIHVNGNSFGLSEQISIYFAKIRITEPFEFYSQLGQ